MNSLHLLQLIPALLMAGVRTTAQPNADYGLKGEYYTGINFDRKVFARIDPNLNFNWRGRAPGAGLDKQFYSVRWTGKLHAPSSGMYRFTVEVDDGVRVWVGNKKIIDAWELHDNITFTGSVMLQADKTYDLRVDYFNDILEGEIKLYWMKPEEFRSSKNSPGSIITPEYLSYKPVKPVSPPVAVAPVVTKPVARTVVAAKPAREVTSRPAPVKTTPPATATSSIAAKVNNRPLPDAARPDAARPDAARPTVDQPTVAPSAFDKLETGETVILKNVLFKQSEYVLLPNSYIELDKLVLTLNNQPALRIEIGGHTDNVGDQRLNQTLSEYRAKVVANYLIQHGIAEDRVRAKGYGGSRPLNGNATETERIVNRRVAFTVW